MARRFLIFVSAEQVSSYLWRDDRLISGRVYPATDAGRAEFDRFLQRHGGQPISLLSDMVEEDFRFENVPHLMGSDRSTLFERKLDQYYRTTPFRHALIQGREKEGRRDDRALFSALTNPALLNPWVEMMVKQAVPLRGIYSAPLVSRSLVSGLGLSHVLLLSWQRHAGLRQTYFIDSNLRFSRLTAGVDQDNFIERVVSESVVTIKYLASLSLLPTDHPLDVCVVCGPGDEQELDARLRKSPDIHYRYLKTPEVAARLGYKGPLEGPDATPLLLHSLAKTPPANQYGNPEHTHFFALWQMRKGLQAAAAALFLATTGWSLFNMWQGFDYHREGLSLTEETRLLENTYRTLTADFPKGAPDTDSMKAALATVEKLAAYSPPAGDMLAMVSRPLEGLPTVHVTSLSWESTFNPAAVGPAQTGAAAPPAAAPGPDELPALVILLAGEIWPFNNDFRKALDTVEALRAQLAAQGLEVTVLTLPLDLRPEASLSGGGGEQMGGRRAPFQLKIVWRRKA